MSRIAIFGGSFNPPHIGHQTLCLMALETCPIDELWVVPACIHYFGKALAPFSSRVEMCRLMVGPLGERVRVSLIEGELENPRGRMLDTLKALGERFPEHAYRLLIGSDILQETERWHEWGQIASLAPPLVCKRHGYPGGELPAPPDVSSSKILKRVRSGLSALPWVPLSVQNYIETSGVYLD